MCSGYNCSLFAYGQTGSGKSYSMMGYGEDKGIIPIACQKIFERMADDEDEDTTMKLECSMLEIYMEKVCARFTPAPLIPCQHARRIGVQVRDLFNPSAGDNLAVREDKKIGFYVKDLTKNAVANYEQVEKVLSGCLTMIFAGLTGVFSSYGSLSICLSFSPSLFS